ncbi:MAG: WG repeat-containing protein [Bacteroidota bacterium]
MKKIIIFFFVLSTFFANAQNVFIYPKNENGKYGAREYESKKVIVPFIYSSFSECDIECAKYNFNKIWKTINTTVKGQLAENYRIDSIYVTSENGEVVLKAFKELICKSGFISKNGQEIIPVELSDYELMMSSPQYVKLNKDWGFLCLGTEVCDENGNIKGSRGGGFYDCFGKEKIPFTNLLKYDYVKSGKVKQNNKWGQVVFLSGKEIVPIKYNSIEYLALCCDSLGYECHLAKLNSKWGVITQRGKELIPFKYDDIGSTNGYYLAAKLNNRWGLIDINEKEILPFIYDSISGVDYTVSEIDYIPDENGNSYPVATKSKSDGGITFLKVMLNNKWGLINLIDTDGNIIDKTKREILPINYNDIVFIEKNFTFGSNSEIIYNTKIKVKINGKYGFVDLSGKELTLFFDEIGEYLYNVDFQQELAPVKLNGKWGFVNRDEIEIIPCKYDVKYQSVGRLYNGITQVKLNDKWGLIDSTGKEIIELKYDKLYYLAEGIVAVCLNNKWGFINELGKEITPLNYDEISPNYYPFAVKLNNKWGFVNGNGKEITPIKYDAIKSYGELSNFQFVIQNNKWGAIDTSGTEVIPLRYDYIKTYCSDRYAYKAQINNKWGIINETGIEIIPVKYDEINTASGYGCSFYSVKLKNKWGVVNQFGKEVLSLKFDSIGDFGRYANSYSPGYEDYVKVKSKNLWGLINIYKNEEILPIKYQEINCVESISVMQENTNAEYRAITFEGAGVKQKNKWGLVGTKGRVIVPIKYDELDCPNYDGICKSCFSDGKIAFKKGDNTFYFDKNGNEIKN